LAQSGLFDADFYAREYPDVRLEGGNPLRHYLSCGAAEGLDPNPFFDTDWYAAARPELTRAGLNPLAHYQLEGARKGYDPSPFFQAEWFEACGRANHHASQPRDGRTGLAAYLSRLTRTPWQHPPKVAVYTAIFGGYDSPPIVAAPDERIRYILFTEQPDLKAPPPWEIRSVPRIFVDPQLDARRIKILPHLFLPDFDVSVWIDANSRLLRLTNDDVRRISECADFVLRRHEFRACVYREADAVLWHRLDSPSRVKRQLENYRSEGFPERFGLHQTAFLVRRHLQENCVRFARSWWDQVFNYSKRDQLSFDYVRWTLDLSVLSLFVKYTNNAALELIPHKRRNAFPFQQTVWATFRVIERGPHRMHPSDASPSSLVAPYEPRYEDWTKELLVRLKLLNATVHATGTPLAGNLCYFDRSPAYLHAPPDPRRRIRRETFFKALLGKKHLFEIGFNAGHSALLALECATAKVTSLDAGLRPYTLPAADFLRGEHPGRFNFLMQDSRRLFELRETLDFGKVDLYRIEGGHEPSIFANDIAAVLHLGCPGAWILVDDVYFESGRSDLERLGSAGIDRTASRLELRRIRGLQDRARVSVEEYGGFPSCGRRAAHPRREKRQDPRGPVCYILHPLIFSEVSYAQVSDQGQLHDRRREGFDEERRWNGPPKCSQRVARKPRRKTRSILFCFRRDRCVRNR